MDNKDFMKNMEIADDDLDGVAGGAIRFINENQNGNKTKSVFNKCEYCAYFDTSTKICNINSENIDLKVSINGSSTVNMNMIACGKFKGIEEC